jgi:cell pole-organizing protein PopZ
MNHNYFSPLRILKDIAVGTAIVAGLTMSAWAQPAQPQQTEQNWAQHRQEVVKARLAKMAERLQINASQQKAWQTYAKVIEDASNMSPPKKFDEKADAAATIRSQADSAAAHAAKLSQLADATAKFEKVLTPEQRTAFDQMARDLHHRGFEGGKPHGGPRGDCGGDRNYPGSDHP